MIFVVDDYWLVPQMCPIFRGSNVVTCTLWYPLLCGVVVALDW